MESMLSFISIIFIVFGILQIILFFKIWGMTNDVSKITRILESKAFNFQESHMNDSQEKVEQPTHQEMELSNDINIGSRVIRLSDEKTMIVDSIENGKFFCKGSMIEGYKYYSREEIKPV